MKQLASWWQNRFTCICIFLNLHLRKYFRSFIKHSLLYICLFFSGLRWIVYLTMRQLQTMTPIGWPGIWHDKTSNFRLCKLSNFNLIFQPFFHNSWYLKFDIWFIFNIRTLLSLSQQLRFPEKIFHLLTSSIYTGVTFLSIIIIIIGFIIFIVIIINITNIILSKTWSYLIFVTF